MDGVWCWEGRGWRHIYDIVLNYLIGGEDRRGKKDTPYMVVRLRLQRFGRKHSPFYRMVAADARAPRDGKFLEIVS